MAMYEVPEQLKSQLQLSANELEDLRNAFSLFDTQSKGSISYEDYESLANSLGLHKPNSTSGLLPDEVNFTQFLLWTIQRTRRRHSSYQLESELREAFGTFDADNKGYLNINDLKQVMLDLGDSSVTDDDVREMIKEANFNQDSHISFEEFRSIMIQQMTEVD